MLDFIENHFGFHFEDSIYFSRIVKPEKTADA